MNNPMLVTAVIDEGRDLGGRRSMVAPNSPAAVLRPERLVVRSTPRPSTSSNTTLRRRRAIGLGRSLRGTAHARLNAFWVAPAAPRQP